MDNGFCSVVRLSACPPACHPALSALSARPPARHCFAVVLCSAQQAGFCVITENSDPHSLTAPGRVL